MGLEKEGVGREEIIVEQLMEAAAVLVGFMVGPDQGQMVGRPGDRPGREGGGRRYDPPDMGTDSDTEDFSPGNAPRCGMGAGGEESRRAGGRPEGRLAGGVGSGGRARSGGEMDSRRTRANEQPPRGGAVGRGGSLEESEPEEPYFSHTLNLDSIPFLYYQILFLFSFTNDAKIWICVFHFLHSVLYTVRIKHSILKLGREMVLSSSGSSSGIHPFTASSALCLGITIKAVRSSLSSRASTRLLSFRVLLKTLPTSSSRNLISAFSHSDEAAGDATPRPHGDLRGIGSSGGKDRRTQNSGGGSKGAFTLGSDVEGSSSTVPGGREGMWIKGGLNGRTGGMLNGRSNTKRYSFQKLLS
ncbi:MAG: hypothetical protein M1827_001372 [Pycnora praestabilis]|nr:MAG: hypothetical protein M1827_001372 [Pycnora praestabilis]